MTPEEIKDRLEYLRGELRAERISYGEIVELQSLAEHIDAGDVELLEAAGVPEFPEETKNPDFELEIQKRTEKNTVLYVHGKAGATMLRVCGLPDLTKNQVDITLNPDGTAIWTKQDVSSLIGTQS